MTTINHEKALSLIKTHGGTVFGVKFVKEDKSIRAMACRLHASIKAEQANKTGRKQGANRDEFMVKVYDMNVKTEDGKGAFRTVNVRNLFELSINGETYVVEG